MTVAVSNTIYNTICTISAVPAVLLRTFEKEDYARQFLAGNIRFGLLQHYQEIEDCRGDETEGRASIQWDLESENSNLHNVTYTGTSLNLYYVLCTSHSGVCKKHLAKFGSFVVEINQPLKLLKRICDAWRNDNRSSSDAFITPVLYNKNGLVPPPPYFIAPPSLVYAQKPASYSHEAEYRYVLCCKVGTPEDPFLTLRLGHCYDICSLISLT
ncbi:MAG: hypothetical protein ABSD64_05115 [Terriglobales bacterium]